MGVILHQAAALPFKLTEDGPRVLLITSRDSGRWVIPKGNVEKGETGMQAAAREAFEESGLRGEMEPEPLGSFTYKKRLRSGRLKPAVVEVFALRVEKQLKKWPERAERRLEWMTLPQAAAALSEPGMPALLDRLADMLRQSVTAGKRASKHFFF